MDFAAGSVMAWLIASGDRATATARRDAMDPKRDWSTGDFDPLRPIIEICKATNSGFRKWMGSGNEDFDFRNIGHSNSLRACFDRPELGFGAVVF
jgi:hypothetical protein